jgi:hypothetical protein
MSTLPISAAASLQSVLVTSIISPGVNPYQQNASFGKVQTGSRMGGANKRPSSVEMHHSRTVLLFG